MLYSAQLNCALYLIEMKERGERAAHQRARGVYCHPVIVWGGVVGLLVIGFIMGMYGRPIMAAVASQLGVQVPQLQSVDVSGAQEIYRLLQQKYNGEVDPAKISQYASKGIASAVGDPYTEYYTPEEAKELENDLKGSIGGGIGAELGMRHGRVAIIRPLKGSPAESAGVQAGDVILSVNDTVVSHATTEEVVRLIRGEIGTSVKLLVQRGGERKELSVKRAEIVSPDVETEVRDNIGIIKLTRFGSDSASKVRAAAVQMKRQGVKGVVLDLRGNAGGYLQTGVDVAGLWLHDVPVVSEQGKHSRNRTLHAGKQAILKDTPTVVLTNAGSASASEIVAGALKDHKAATIIGEKSYGKGSVQEVVHLQDGAILKVTVASWFTPAGKNISKEGVAPDVAVELTSEDVNHGRDPQLDAALGKLRQ